MRKYFKTHLRPSCTQSSHQRRGTFPSQYVIPRCCIPAPTRARGMLPSGWTWPRATATLSKDPARYHLLRCSAVLPTCLGHKKESFERCRPAASFLQLLRWEDTTGRVTRAPGRQLLPEQPGIGSHCAGKEWKHRSGSAKIWRSSVLSWQQDRCCPACRRLNHITARISDLPLEGQLLKPSRDSSS